MLKFALNSLAMQIKLGKVTLEEYAPEWDTSYRPEGELETVAAENGSFVVSDELALKMLEDDGMYFNAVDAVEGNYSVKINITSQHNEYTQIPISLFVDNDYRGTLSFQGTNGKADEKDMPIGKIGVGEHYIRVAYRPHGITMNEFIIEKENTPS